MSTSNLYTEETFGILTDDDIYLDCVLVKPVDLTDERLRVLRVWVPKYPLTKTSLITCARQEVLSYGRNGTIAHLVFDLRGTGESEGRLGDKDFHLDLQAIKSWSEERFGHINFGFLGMPEAHGQVNIIPIRPGVVMESYVYPANSEIEESEHGRSDIIYLATYGNFDRIDDALCLSLSRAGYNVYGLDPLRYLLHASSARRLTPAELWKDCQTFCQAIATSQTSSNPPMLLGQPISAGLALLWGAGTKEIGGVAAIGKTDAAFKGHHIFDSAQVHNFFLSRHVYQIAPRPVVLVQQEGHALGGKRDEHDVLFETCGHPRRQECVQEVNPDFLISMVEWLQNPVELSET